MEESDSEYETEEAVVLVELNGIIDSNFLHQEQTPIKILGIETDEPILQIGHYIFSGHYEDTMGTVVAYEPTIVQDSDGKEETSYKLLTKTDKKLSMKRIFLEKKDQSSDQESAASFNSQDMTQTKNVNGLDRSCGSTASSEMNHALPAEAECRFVNISDKRLEVSAAINGEQSSNSQTSIEVSSEANKRKITTDSHLVVMPSCSNSGSDKNVTAVLSDLINSIEQGSTIANDSKTVSVINDLKKFNTDADLVHKSFKEKWKREKSKKRTKYERSIMTPQQVACDSDSSNEKAFGKKSGADNLVSDSENDCELVRSNDCEITNCTWDSDVSQSDRNGCDEINYSDAQNQLVQSSTDENITFVSSSSKPKLHDDKCSSSGDTNSAKITEFGNACESSVSEIIGTSQISLRDSESNASSSTNNLSMLNNNTKSSIYEISQSSKDNLSRQEFLDSCLKESNECQTSNLATNVLTNSISTQSINVATSSFHEAVDNTAMEVDFNENLSSSEITQSGSSRHTNGETSETFIASENSTVLSPENEINNVNQVSAVVSQDIGSLSEVTQSHNCEIKKNAYNEKRNIKLNKDDVCSQSTDSHNNNRNELEMKSLCVSSCDSNKSNMNETFAFNSSTTDEDGAKLLNEACEVTQSDRNAKKEGTTSVEKGFLESTSIDRRTCVSQNNSEMFSDVKDPCASSDDVNIIPYSKSDEVKKKNSSRNSSCEVTQSFGCDEFLIEKDDKPGTNECEVFQPLEDVERFSHASHISEMKDLCVSSDDVNNSASEETQSDKNISDANCEVTQSVSLDENVMPRVPCASLDSVKNSACEVTQSSLTEIKETNLNDSERITQTQMINESVSKSSEFLKEECVSSADSPFKIKRKKSTKESKYGEVTQSNHNTSSNTFQSNDLHNVETEVSNECEVCNQSSDMSENLEVTITFETEKDVCESSDDINVSNSNHSDDNKNYTSEVSQSFKYEYSASGNSDKANISSECDIISHSIGLTVEQLDISSGESASNLCESSEDVMSENIHITSCDPDECTSTNRYTNKSSNEQKQGIDAHCPVASNIAFPEGENQDLSSSVNSRISDSSSVNSSVIVSSSIECAASNEACIIYSSSSNASTSSSGKSGKYKSSVKIASLSCQSPEKDDIFSNNIPENLNNENKLENGNELVSSFVQSSNDVELDDNTLPNVSGSEDSQYPSSQTHTVPTKSHILPDKENVESSNIVPSTSDANMLNASFRSKFSSDKLSAKTGTENLLNESVQALDNLMKAKGKKRKILSPAREAEPLKKKILSRAIKACNERVEKDATQSSTFQSNPLSSTIPSERTRPSLLEVMVSSASDFRNSLIQDGNAFGKKTSNLSSSGEEAQSSLSTAISNEAAPSTNDVSPSKSQENTMNASSSDTEWTKKTDFEVSGSIEDKNSDSTSFELHSTQYHVSQSSEIINTHSSTSNAESLMSEPSQQDLVQSSTNISIVSAHHSANNLTTSEQVTSADETVMPSLSSEEFENSDLEGVQTIECMLPKPSISEKELIESEVSSSPCELYYSQQNAMPVDDSGQCAVVEGNFLESDANDKMLNINEDDVSCNVIVTSVSYDLMPLSSTSVSDSGTNELNISQCDAYLSASSSHQPFIDTFQCESSHESEEKFVLRTQNLELLSSDIGSSSEAEKINLNSASADLQMECNDSEIMPLSSASEVGMNSSDLIIETDLSGSTVNEIVVDMYEESCESFGRQSKESTLCEVTESHSKQQELNTVSVDGAVSCSSVDYAVDKKQYYDSYIYQSNDFPSTEVVDKSSQDVVSSFEDVIVGSNVLPMENVSQSEQEQVDSVLCSDSAGLNSENAESSLNLPIYSINENIPDMSSLPTFSSINKCEQQSFNDNPYISSKVHSFTSDTCHLPSVSNIDDSSESISQQGHLVTQSSGNNSTVCEAGSTDAEKLYSDSNGSSSSEFSDVQDTEMWTQPESFDYGETEIPEELLGPSTAFIFQAGEDPDTSNSREND